MASYALSLNAKLPWFRIFRCIMRYFYRRGPGISDLKTTLSIILIFFCFNAYSQTNLRQKQIRWTGDSIVLDSLSLVPGSLELRDASMNLIDTSRYGVRYFTSTIFPKENAALLVGEVNVYYRTFPFNLSRQYVHKDISLIEIDQSGFQNPFVYQVSANDEDFFELDGLNKSGSISRGVSLGNNQDLAVNSNLDLQLSGKLTDDVKILAAISDGNIPIQPDGNTQQLQEFDRVFIQLYNDQYKLIAGDYRMRNEASNHFLRYNKSLQGGRVEALIKTDENGSELEKGKAYYTSFSAAVSKGKFAINRIPGIEGNQGPYLLRGAENESFIVVISGTEKVYIDGKLLKRGQNYDYIIDYNSAELTFTPNQIITKDKRITVEFQYSDRYYARSLYHLRGGYRDEKMEVEVNYYNEGDNKNQSLDRELSNEDKTVLSAIGDSLGRAIVPNIRFDSSADLSNEILYKLVYATQPFGPDSFFAYSTDPDSAFWRVGFSYVGPNSGDYVQASSDANGKVFAFVPRDPLSGRLNGDYMPVTVIVTPKRKQMLTMGGKYNLSENSSLSFEGAYSSNDINTFSSQQDQDNDGYGFLIKQDNSLPMSNDLNPLKLDLGLMAEYISPQFKEIERFRGVEFYRDWNLQRPIGTDPTGLVSQQDQAGAYLGLSKQGVGRITYSINSYRDVGSYEGINNKINGSFKQQGFTARMRGSYLSSKGDVNTSFFRYNALASQKVWKFRVGLEAEEENSQKLDPNSDTLAPESFRWTWWKAFVESADSSGNSYRLSYVNRYDYLPDEQFQRLKAASFAEDASFELYLQENPKHQFIGRITYRRLEVLDSSIIQSRSGETIQGKLDFATARDESILAKLDYRGLFFNRLVSWQTYYEIGSGLEIKREVVFEGPLDPGQGSYIWNDINDDGIQQKDEFFIAPTPLEGVYNRVFLPTNEFQRAYTNTFNQVIFIKPEVLLSKKRGIAKFAGRFSDRLTYRIDKKSNEENVYNPFRFNFESDSLLSLNNTWLNTVYFNRLSSAFGLEFNYRENNFRNLFISGKESRSDVSRGLRARWNISKKFTLNTEFEEGRKQAASENFSDRNFDIVSRTLSPEFYFQPGIAFRVGVTYDYSTQENSQEYGGQNALSDDFGLELRYNVAQKGSFQMNVNYILIAFEGVKDPAITVEMLNGLQAGRNATWSLLYQRNLGKYLQLSVNYSGRQSENSSIVNLGGAQVRAFF
ncbi:MAG: hypothetical protein RH916_05505 [Vicingaceae bacterium]